MIELQKKATKSNIIKLSEGLHPLDLVEGMGIAVKSPVFLGSAEWTGVATA